MYGGEFGRSGGEEGGGGSRQEISPQHVGTFINKCTASRLIQEALRMYRPRYLGIYNSKTSDEGSGQRAFIIILIVDHAGPRRQKNNTKHKNSKQTGKCTELQ